MADHDDSQHLQSLLSSSNRDFLVRNNGDQVKIDSLDGKGVWLYFSASSCSSSQQFIPSLVEVYQELSLKGNFEVVYVSIDNDNESFKSYFSEMPWLAIPFSDSITRDSLVELFNVNGIPYLVILDENGKVLIDDGVYITREYGVEGYPFTTEHNKEIKEQEEKTKREQSLKSILVSPSRDFVISSDGKMVPVSELEGKTVGLYFALFSYNICAEFTPKLIEVYNDLKAKKEPFEVVLIPLDEGNEESEQGFATMPWLSLPYDEKHNVKLARYFELSAIPTLVIIGPDGKTLHSNLCGSIEEHGILAYPFTPKKYVELEKIEKAKKEAQTLESILVSGEYNYVVGKDGLEIPVSELVGKNILLYFSAHGCSPCRAFLPKLIEAYQKIKETDDAFEVIFISSDMDQLSFDEFFSKMPWLALPFGDKRKASLGRHFKVQGTHMVVAIGSTGRTLSTEAKNLIIQHGSKAYPFTDEWLKEIEAEYEEMVKGWPEKVKHALHEEHEVLLTSRGVYTCDMCKELGNVWAFYCEDCDFDLCPKCALEQNKETNKADDDPEICALK